MSNYIHSSSYIDENVIIGDNTKIWYFNHISKGAVIGRNCNIGQNVFVDAGVKIGNTVKIQNNVSVYKGVIILDNVFLGPSCVFTNVINPRSFIDRKSEIKETIVKTGVTVGANSTIICGITLGEYSMIAAGATVTKDVPDFALVKGSPARISGYVCKCGNKLVKSLNEYHCSSCNLDYIIIKNNEIRLKEE